MQRHMRKPAEFWPGYACGVALREALPFFVHLNRTCLLAFSNKRTRDVRSRARSWTGVAACYSGSTKPCGPVARLVFFDRSERDLISEGATGFDTIALREEAGRGLLATLNRGTVKLN